MVTPLDKVYFFQAGVRSLYGRLIFTRGGFPAQKPFLQGTLLKSPTPTYFKGWNRSVFRQAADGSNMKV